MKYKSFEDYILEQHSKQYKGLDDDMSDDYVEWLDGLTSDQWLEFGDEYLKAQKENI